MKYCDFKDREICFFDSEKKAFPLRGYKADFETFIDKIPEYERDLKKYKYNSYCSIAQYNPMPFFTLHDNKKRWQDFKQWVQTRDFSITSIDFFIDFDGKDLKKTFEDTLKVRQYLSDMIGSNTQYLNTYFSGNKGFHLLGKLGSTFGSSPQTKLRANYELATQLKPLCPTIDETIYDLARVRKILGSKVHSPKYGETRVVSCNTLTDFEQLEFLLESKDWKLWEAIELKRLNKIETSYKIGL